MDIRSLRKCRGWSQEELAERADLSVRTVQRLEAHGGGHAASYLSLAEAFEIEPQIIMAGALPLPLLSSRLATLLGAALALPGALFLLTNLIRYEFGVIAFPDIFASLLEIGWVDFLFPFLIIGGCLAALLLNLAACIGLEFATTKGAVEARRFVLYGRFNNLFLLLAAGLVLAAILGYAILENLSHWIVEH